MKPTPLDKQLLITIQEYPDLCIYLAVQIPGFIPTVPPEIQPDTLDMKAIIDTIFQYPGLAFLNTLNPVTRAKNETDINAHKTTP